MKNRAFLAFSKEHFEAVRMLESLPSLRNMLSNQYGLGSCISFRKNTTLVIIDVLEGLMEEEGYQLAYSDLEHPCVVDQIKLGIPKDRSKCLGLYDHLLKGEISQIEEQLSTSYEEPTIYFFSHVLWNCGIRLDVERMAAKIKSNNPRNIIVVDGAQALGNVNPLFTGSLMESSIDAYVACTHKWLCTKNTLGFVSVNKDSPCFKSGFFQRLFRRDIFSFFSGKIENFEVEWSTATIDVVHLQEIVDQLLSSSHNRKGGWNIVKQIQGASGVHAVPNIEGLTDMFQSFFGKREDLKKVCDRIQLSTDHLVEDPNLPEGCVWLRVESE